MPQHEWLKASVQLSAIPDAVFTPTAFHLKAQGREQSERTLGIDVFKLQYPTGVPPYFESPMIFGHRFTLSQISADFPLEKGLIDVIPLG